MTVGQWASGNQNVQISQVAAGATIQVTIGVGAPVLLPLKAATVRLGPTVSSPARLLRARSGVVPFVDRAGLLAGLTDWMGSPDPYGTYLVGGRGGSGKARLGVHLCGLAEQSGWVAGLLADDTDPAQVSALVGVPSPRLVVIDYAETRVEQLEVLLPVLAAYATQEWPVRVLLLVRAEPRTGTDWTDRLRTSASDELEQILDDTIPQILTTEQLTVPDRISLFDTAMSTFAARSEQPRSDSPVDSARVVMAEIVFATPLLIMIAAYLAVHDPDRAVPATRMELLTGLAKHEDRYWQEAARRQRVQIGSAELRGRVVALAGMLGADSEAEAVTHLAMLPELAGEALVGRRYELARWIHQLYAGPRWWNGGVRSSV